MHLKSSYCHLWRLYVTTKYQLAETITCINLQRLKSDNNTLDEKSGSTMCLKKYYYIVEFIEINVDDVTTIRNLCTLVYQHFFQLRPL